MKAKSVSQIVGVELSLTREEAEDYNYWYCNRNLSLDRADNPDMFRRGLNKAADIAAGIRNVLDIT